ncbi:MAG: hypothetical protein QW328_09695 [Nitrososphaerota archaeon]
MTEPVLNSVLGLKCFAPDRGVFGASPPRPSEEVPLTEKQVREGLKLLLELVIAKKNLYVKARDLVHVMGFSPEDYSLVLLGKVLSSLSRRGLAIRWNNVRPLRYTLIPKVLWLRFADIEARQGFSFECEKNDAPCPLVGLCPYWVLRGE